MSTYDYHYDNRGTDRTYAPRTAPIVPKPASHTAFYHDYAVLSRGAYDPVAHGDETAKLGYDIDKELSTVTHTVYTHRSTGKAVIAYKGTTPAISPLRGNDLTADAGILFSIPSFLNGRFREADRTYRAAANKYGKNNVEVTGHSLGGSQAIYIGRKYNAKGIAFDPGSGPGDAELRLEQDVAEDFANHFNAAHALHLPSPGSETGVKVVASSFKGRKRASYDIRNAVYGVAGLYHLPGREKRTWITPKFGNSHKIENFI